MIESPDSNVLAAMERCGWEPKRSGNGWSFRVRIGDRQDRNPSGSMSVGEDGRVLLHDHAGKASVADMVQALGLTMSDLYHRDESRSHSGPEIAPGTVLRAPRQQRGDATSSTSHPVWSSLSDAIASKGADRYWAYADAEGEPVGAVLRRGDGKGKWVRPIHLTREGWVDRGMPAPRPLLRLPDVILADPDQFVYVVEGEKCADALCACGLLATTSAGGSNAAGKTDWSPLHRRDVVILPDEDEAGEKYAADVVRLAHAAGARRIRVVRLRDRWGDLSEGGDVADVLDKLGGDAGAVRVAIEELAADVDPEPITWEARPSPPENPTEALFTPTTAYIRDFLAALSTSTQTPPEMAGWLGLVIASACVANVAHVRGYGDHIERGPLWGLVLSEPGTRKSSIMSSLTRPIVDWQRRRAGEMKAEIARADAERRMLEKRLKWLEDQAAKGTGQKAEDHQQQAVQLAEQLELMDAVRPPQLITTEPTPEALTSMMSQHGERALVASAEADAMDIVQGRYSGNRNFGIYLCGHAGDAISTLRVGRESVSMSCPALAVALCVQPASVLDLLDDPQAKGRGLIARFATIMVPNRLGNREVRPDPVSPELRSEWAVAVDRLLSFPPTDDPVIVELSREADALYHRHQRQTERSLGWGELAQETEWGGKRDGLVLRVALTLHALGTWALRGTPQTSGTVTAETMRAAIAWVEFLTEAHLYVVAHIGETDADRERTQLVRWVRSRGGDVTIADLSTSGPRIFRGDRKSAEAALEALAPDHGDWYQPPQQGAGRPRARRFKLHEAVDAETRTGEPESQVSTSTPPVQDHGQEGAAA